MFSRPPVPSLLPTGHRSLQEDEDSEGDDSEEEGESKRLVDAKPPVDAKPSVDPKGPAAPAAADGKEQSPECKQQ